MERYIVVEGEPVGPAHYVQQLAEAVAVAKHHGTRVVMDVYDAEQLLALLQQPKEA